MKQTISFLGIAAVVQQSSSSHSSKPSTTSNIPAATETTTVITDTKTTSGGSKWKSNKTSLSDGPNINPGGVYASFLLGLQQ